MHYKKTPNAAATAELLKAVKTVVDNGNDYLVLLDMDDRAFAAGSARMPLVAFMAKCMLSDQETAQLFMNVVLNYILNKLNIEGCEDCPVYNDCKGANAAKKSECEDEALAGTLKKLIDQMRVAQN